MNPSALRLVVAGALAAPLAAFAADPAPEPLEKTMAALDAAAFAAFNDCAAPGQLEKYASYFAPDVEFYHDLGGVTWTRDAMIDATRRNVCGKFQRELVPGTLRAWPIKDFGALVRGEHEFCHFKPGGTTHPCEGRAEFTILWRQQGDKWVITRAFSYGHLAKD